MSSAMNHHPPREEEYWKRARVHLGWQPSRSSVNLEAMPFGPHDATAGSEIELQAVVIGSRETVDLPLTIESSSFYANLQKRSAAQDTPKRALRALQRFLVQNPDQVWDNSWVRFPRRVLSASAQRVLERDLLADKSNPNAGPRRDGHRFVSGHEGDPILRVPVSYLLKLALADAVGSGTLPSPMRATADRMLEHFLSDNSSPESFSFYVVSKPERATLGQALARETSLRFLMTQLLTAYANDRFELVQTGQRAVVYFSPHPAVRQKQLNECIPDSYYRDLFMSPCLSGWDQGESKHDYMRLCHEVLSRSHLNAVAKVRDAGLIASNVVVLPNTSNISLANNGIHITLGSKHLSGLLCDGDSGFGRAEEKAVGDLVAKVFEHFLPLFIGTYSCAPYRLDFAEFHAEKALSFLPHELDFTHLRMLWRRWKKKARVSFLGQPMIPSGYECIDKTMAFLLRLKGDLVPDFRLIDYLVAPLSTDQSPALDGTLGNTDRLKRDLADQGVFDPRMSLYAFFRARLFEQMGFSGFEGRHYSISESIRDDLSKAIDLQSLITAMAFKMIAAGRIHHADIPDDPTIESERRQIIFGTAIGVPTFFVHGQTGNRLIRRIVETTKSTRQSRRYPGHIRVHHHEYRLSLLAMIRSEAPDLIEALDAQPMLADLEDRLRSGERSAAGRITKGILGELRARDPFSVPALPFNRAAEQYYRTTLRHRHIKEAIATLRQECESDEDCFRTGWAQVMPWESGIQDPLQLLEAVEQGLISNQMELKHVIAMIQLLIGLVHVETADSRAASTGIESIPLDQVQPVDPVAA